MNETERPVTNAVSLLRYRMARSDEIIHAETRSLLAYWQGLRRGRVAPFRAEVDPRDMTCEARHLFIIEVLADGTQRFRLAGTGLIDTFSMELRGHSTRIIMEGRAQESFAALIAETLAEPGIGYARLSPAGLHGGDLWEMLLLPLRSENGTMDRVIGLMHQLAGMRRSERLLPLRFTFEEMWIEPIEVTSTDEPAPIAQLGFAEEQKSFTGLPDPDSGARLTAIEGGRGLRDPGQDRRQAKPSLRLIKDE